MQKHSSQLGDPLAEIQKAETEAEEIISAAEAKMDQWKKDEMQKSQEQYSQTLEAKKQATQKILNEKKNTIAEKGKKVMSEVVGKCKNIEKAAQKNLSKAVESIVDELEKALPA